MFRIYSCLSWMFSAVLLATPLVAQGKVTPKVYPSKTAPRKAKKAVGDGTVVTNAASYLVGVSPGGLATVFGNNLTDVTGVVYANSNPFPLELANVRVYVNGVGAPIFSIAYANGEDQISFQVPWETNTGLGAAEVAVYDYGTLVADVVTDSYVEDPGIFAFQQYGQNYAVALHADDYSLVTFDNPAVRNEVLILYVTGLGPVNQFIPDGLGAPSNPLAYTSDPYSLDIGNESATIYFSGLAPGFVGLYQINFAVPGDAPAGDLPVTIYSAYANSQTVSLSVK